MGGTDVDGCGDLGDAAMLRWPLTQAQAFRFSWKFYLGAGGLLAILAWLHDDLQSDPVGAAATLIASLVLAGYATLPHVAAGVAKDVLRLDPGGIHAWTGRRVRELAWRDVFSVEPVAYGGGETLGILVAGSRTVRIPPSLLPLPTRDAAREVRRWIDQNHPPGFSGPGRANR